MWLKREKNSENRASEGTARDGRTVVAKIDMSRAQSRAINNGARVLELLRSVKSGQDQADCRVHHLDAVAAKRPRATRHFNKKLLVLLGFFLH